MQRRSFLLGASAESAAWLLPHQVAAANPAADIWGENLGYPTGWGPKGETPHWEKHKAFRVGNYSGGYETLFPLHKVPASTSTSPLTPSPRDDLRFGGKIVDDYMRSWPATGLLIARGGRIFVERYGFARKPDMRFTSWSMAKSVTSLLLGICIDKGLIASLDDPAERYVESLKGTLHGQTALRHLANMSSGAQISHDKDNAALYPRAFLNRGANLEPAVREWNWRQEPAGLRFNYNELCPLTIGMVIRRVTGKTMAAFCAEQIWQPIGAEFDASWLTDSYNHEFNCIGFSARLRDWARLAQLVAQGGRMNGRQIVSTRWIDECSSWSDQDRQVRYGSAERFIGYKCFFWHPRADGSWMMMLGHHGQVVLADRKSQTVLVHTAVDNEPGSRRDLLALFDAATKLS